MWWEQVKDWITWFFNLTLPVVGISLGVLCLLIYKVFSKTSFGKKQIAKMNEKFNKLATRSDAFIDKVEKEVEYFKKECDAKIKALSEYYENMLAQKQAKEDELESLIIAISENIHNENIKELIEKYKSKMNGYRTIMTDKIESVKAEYDERLRALEGNLYGKEDNKAKEE